MFKSLACVSWVTIFVNVGVTATKTVQMQFDHSLGTCSLLGTSMEVSARYSFERYSRMTRL